MANNTHSSAKSQTKRSAQKATSGAREKATRRKTTRAEKTHSEAVKESAKATRAKAAEGARETRELSGVEEYKRWIAKYEPEEQRIIAEYEKRLARRVARREEIARAFGDLCEATEGDVIIWMHEGLRFSDILFSTMNDAWTRKCADRYFALTNAKPFAEDIGYYFICVYFTMLLMLQSVWTAVAVLAILGWIMRDSAKVISSVKKRSHRPLYYERETARRRNLAADRRRIARRSTLSKCPTREEVLDAWLHAKDSKEAAVRFGSMMNDLECFVDNSLRFADGRISGREAGIKGWLAFNIPALLYKYKTVMRYKAMAKRLRQVVELKDPVPAVAVLAEDSEVPKDASVVRAAALWQEVAKDVTNVTSLMTRIDELTNPLSVDEINMLSEWREIYKKEITARNKSRWWRMIVSGLDFRKRRKEHKGSKLAG